MNSAALQGFAALRCGAGLRARLRRALSLLAGVALSSGPLACRREVTSSAPAPPPASAASSGHAAPRAVEAGVQALRVTLRPLTARQFEVQFFNQSAAELIVIRPSSGSPLKAVPGLPGHTVLPAASYKLEALEVGSERAFRGVYAPLSLVAESELRLPAHGTAAVGVELPFELPPGRYALRFWYEYFQSSHLVPAGWYTGLAAAPPLAIEVKP